MEVGLLAAVLGLSVALAPGPSLALACANTLRGGVRAGISTSVAAALADLAIAVVSVVILFGVGDRPASFVGVIGGLMVLGFGVDSLVVSRRRDPVPRGAATHRKFVQAALLELSLPQALLFGLTAV
ncbi:MAG: LysE family transporter, partial [Nocardioidaceae bacterium]